jgi:hypothetical protein
MTGRPLLPLYWRRGIRPTGLRVILILTPRLPSVRFVDPVLWNSPPCSMTRQGFVRSGDFREYAV